MFVCITYTLEYLRRCAARTHHFAVVMFAYKICCPSGYSSTTIRPLACSRYCCARAERTSTRFLCCTQISTVQVLFSSRTRCKNRVQCRRGMVGTSIRMSTRLNRTEPVGDIKVVFILSSTAGLTHWTKSLAVRPKALQNP